jgi:hypothetical protein
MGMDMVKGASLIIMNGDHTLPATGICQVSAGGWCCWEPGVVMVQTGCEHEHLGPEAPMCKGCLDLCHQIAGTIHTTSCEQCGHGCRIMMKVVDTGEILIF